ncbi:hypothetical protein MBLNU459_g2246t1 [Dothideomycetes sp. NU459]
MVALAHYKQIATFSVAIFFLVTSLAITTLRCIARLKIRAWGVDDYLLIAGQFTFVGTIAVAIAGCFAGFGVPDQYLQPINTIYADHASYAYFPVYVATLMFVKTSICFTLLRIAETKPIRYTLYGLLALCTLDGFVAIVAILDLCHPIAAGWDPTAGTCAPNDVYIDIGIFISISAIMKRSLKLSVVAVLSLGFFASAGCIVRLHYLANYNLTTNFIEGLADLTIWSIVESGLGVCLASIPALKPLLRSYVSSWAATVQQTRGTSRPLSDTFGGSAKYGRNIELTSMAKNNKDFSTNVTSRGIDRNDDDDSSEKDILSDQIMVNSEVEMREERAHVEFRHESV